MIFYGTHIHSTTLYLEKYIYYYLPRYNLSIYLGYHMIVQKSCQVGQLNQNSEEAIF